MNIKFEYFNLDNIANWPRSMYYGVFGLVAFLILSVGYYLDIQSQMALLQQAKLQEKALRVSFDRKQQESATLMAHLEQMVEMKKTFGSLLQKLPSKTEIPALLEDISDAGIRMGLTFKLFRPLTEEDKVFYAQMPIEISVAGKYHALAQFVSRVANLKRIVVLGDFTLKPLESYLKATQRTDFDSQQLEPEELNLTIMAWTYRYVEGGPK